MSTVLDIHSQHRDRGGPGGPGMIGNRLQTITMDSAGRYYVWSAGDVPQVFSGAGEFIGRLGRRGSGPGEVEGWSIVIPVAGDSTLVIAREQMRANLYGPNGVFVRQIGLPGHFISATPLKWPDTVVVAGIVSDQQRFSSPVYSVSFAGTMARVLHSGSATGGDEFQLDGWLGIAQSLGHHWWTIH